MAATLQIGSEYLTSQGGDILEAVVEAELPRLLSHGRAILPTARVLLQRDSVTSAVLEDTLLLYMDEWPVLYGRVVPGGYQVFGHRVALQLEAYLPNPPVTYESTELQSIGAIAKEIADNNGIAVRPSSFWDPQGAFVLQGRAAVPSPRPVLDLLAQAVWEGTGLLSFVPIRSETTDDEGNVTQAWSTQGKVVERLRHKAADTPVIQTSLEEPHVGGDRRYPLANYIDVRPTGVQPLTFRDQASIDLYGVQALPGPIYLSFVSTRFMASLWAAYYLGRFSNLQIFCDVKVDGYWPLGDPWVANLISGDPMVFAPEFADGDVYQTWKARYDLVASTTTMTGLRVLDVAPPTEGLTPVGGGGGGGGGGASTTEEQFCYYATATADPSLLPALPAANNEARHRTDRDYRPFAGTLDELPTQAELDPTKPVLWRLKRLYSVDPTVAEAWYWDGIALQPRVIRPEYGSDASFTYRVRPGEAVYWELPRATYEGVGTLDYTVTGLPSNAGLSWNKSRHLVSSATEITDDQAGTLWSFFLVCEVKDAQSGGPLKPRVLTTKRLTVHVLEETSGGATPVGAPRNLEAAPSGTGYERWTRGLAEWDQPVAADGETVEVAGILKYEIRAKQASDDEWSLSGFTTDAGTTTYPFVHLVQGTTYDVEVRSYADESAGYSHSEWVAVQFTTEGPPLKTPLTKPVITSVPAERVAVFRPSAPAGNVKHYLVQWRRNPAYSWTQWDTAEPRTGNEQSGGRAMPYGKGQVRVQAIAEPGSSSRNSEWTAPFDYDRPRGTAGGTAIDAPTNMAAPSDHVTATSAKLSCTVPGNLLHQTAGTQRWTCARIHFYWYHRGNKGGYTQRSFVKAAGPPGSTCTHSPEGLDPNVEYQWHVVAETDSEGYQHSADAAGPGFQTKTRPGSPTDNGPVGIPQNPTDTNETKDSAVLGWDAVTGAASYTITLWPVDAANVRDGDYRYIPVRGATSQSVTGLTADHGYGWNVRANPAAGWRANPAGTADQFFRTLADPDKDNAPAPTNRTVTEQIKAGLFGWAAPTAAGASAIVGYMLRLRAKTAPASPWRYERTTDTSFPWGGLTSRQEYEAAIKARVQPGRTSFPTKDSAWVAFPDFTPLPDPGTPPKGVADPTNVRLLDAHETSLDIGFAPPANTLGFAGFRVRWQKESGGRVYFQSLHATARRYTLPNLDPATAFVVEVQSRGRTGYSPSGWVKVTPNPSTDAPTVPTIPAPANPTPRAASQYRIGQTTAWLPWTNPSFDTNRRGYLFEWRELGGTWNGRTLSTGQQSISLTGLNTATAHEARIKSLGQNGAPDNTPVYFTSFTTQARSTTYTASAVSVTVRNDNISSTGFRMGFSQASGTAGTAHYEAEWRKKGTTNILGRGRTTSTSSSQSVQASGLTADTEYEVRGRAIGGTHNGHTYRNSQWGTWTTVRTKAASTGGTTPPPSLPASPTPTGLSTAVYNTGLHGGQHQTKRIVMSWSWSGNLASNVGFVVSFTNAAGQAVRFTTTRTSANYYMSPADGFVFNWSVQALGDASSFGPSGTASDSYTF